MSPERRLSGIRQVLHSFGSYPRGLLAHVRRKFKELWDQFSNNKPAKDALKLIRRLYAVERLAKQKELSFDEIRDLRQEKSAPVIKELRRLLDDAFVRVDPSTPEGKAIKYALNQWPKLLVYLNDGRIPIDNNFVENAVRPFAVGRKNWMFSGGPRGAHASAWLYTLVEPAKANGLEPYWYLRYLFEMLPKAKSDDDLRALLPHRIDRSLVKTLGWNERTLVEVPSPSRRCFGYPLLPVCLIPIDRSCLAFASSLSTIVNAMSASSFEMVSAINLPSLCGSMLFTR